MQLDENDPNAQALKAIKIAGTAALYFAFFTGLAILTAQAQKLLALTSGIAQ
jgi:hypothetical protein